MTTTKNREDQTGEPQDAIAMLLADHKKVKQLFKEFADLKEKGSEEEKATVVEQICNELTIHATIEEEIFYPAVRAAIDDEDLMDEAEVEHAGAKELISQLEDADPDEELYDAKVTVLGEQIDHHVKEEEGDMFPKAKKSKVDTTALGAQMLKRKQALMAQLGMATADEAAETASPAKQKSRG